MGVPVCSSPRLGNLSSYPASIVHLSSACTSAEELWVHKMRPTCSPVVNVMPGGRWVVPNHVSRLHHCRSIERTGHQDVHFGSVQIRHGTHTAAAAAAAAAAAGAGNRHHICCAQLDDRPRGYLNEEEEEEEEESELDKPRSSIRDFTRFRDNGLDGAELQTAIVSYRKDRPWWDVFGPAVTVDLVSVVHIADKDYFKDLQTSLDGYDRVLYEMVANENDLVYLKRPRHQPGGKRRIAQWRPSVEKKAKRRQKGSKLNVISVFQRMMAKALVLDFQLENLNYARVNWVHADLTWQSFRKLQKERGETLFSFARKVTGRSTMALLRLGPFSTDAAASGLATWRQWLFRFSRIVPMPLLALLMIEGVCSPSQTRLCESPEIKALLGLDLAVAMKVFLARQLTNDLFDNAAEELASSVIIGERNLVALEQLTMAIDDGCRRVAIFYGSGHLPDIDKRLRSDYGFKAVGVQWRTAWKIPGGDKVNPFKFMTVGSDQVAKVLGWPLNRFQTLGLTLLSLTLALDLCFWEALVRGLDTYAGHVLQAIMENGGGGGGPLL